jgi:hypothetical protein
MLAAAVNRNAFRFFTTESGSSTSADTTAIARPRSATAPAKPRGPDYNDTIRTCKTDACA